MNNTHDVTYIPFDEMDKHSIRELLYDAKSFMDLKVEKKKYLAKHVVEEVKKAGFNIFRTNPEHLRMWKA